MIKLQKILGIIVAIITIITAPVALYVYQHEQNTLREERAYGTYDALDDKFIDLQKLCLNYSDLDVFETPFEKSPILNEKQKKQEEVLLLVRLALYERAFLMYRNADSQGKKEQWKGWELNVKTWLRRRNFREMWDSHASTFDDSFFNHFNKNIPDLIILPTIDEKAQ